MTGALLAALLLCARAGAAPAPAARAPRWVLDWSDEFSGPAGARPDPSRWAYDRGAGGWGNAELETYCAPGSPPPCDPARPNAALDGRGRLAIVARRGAGGAWTSARLKTEDRVAFRSGRIEARLRLPAGAGLWPAFWLLGADIRAAGWPSCGEIDVMENVPAGVPGGLGPETVKATVHGPGYSGGRGIGRAFRFPGGARVDGGFHVYGVIRAPDRLSFYVDDWRRPFFTVTPADLPAGKAWVFDRPFFLLLNLAVGGSWPKAPDASTPDPATLLVDWVRVYRAAP
jgi:beta-glucanase (GH16 family)